MSLENSPQIDYEALNRHLGAHLRAEQKRRTAEAKARREAKED